MDSQKKEYYNDYLNTLKECSENLNLSIQEKLNQINDINIQIKNLKAKADAAIEAAKREEEKQLNIEKYKISVNELDIIEINRLREIAPYFRNARAIYKIIWESYYRNKTSDLINRIVGTGIKTGIYKITNLLNQKVYIG